MTPRRSLVWKFFRISSSKAAVCRNCGKEVIFSGNTTNLRNHMKRNHALSMTQSLQQSMQGDETHQDLVEPDEEEVTVSQPLSVASTSQQIPSSTAIRTTSTQPGIDEAFAFLTSFDSAGKRAKEVTEKIVYMIYKDSLPINIVEGRGFQELMKKILPHYKVPSRKTIQSLIDRKYLIEKEKLRDELHNIKHVCITADIWTDTMKTISYLGLTVHYIKRDMMTSSMLGLQELSSSHTASYIAHSIQEILQEWNISKEKVIAVVTDSASNMVKACRDLFGREKHLPCFAHLINLVATNGLTDVPAVKNIIDKVKDSVTFFKHSVVAADKMRQLQLDEGIQSNEILKLKTSIVTRWNSTFYMLERFVKLSNYVGRVLLQNPKAPTMLSGYELDLLKEIAIVLSPLEQITREISGQKYPTTSSVIPLINCMKNCLQVHCQSRESREAKDLSKSLLDQLQLRFQTVEEVELYTISTLLDPRFKKLHFKDINALSIGIAEIDQQLSHSRNDKEPNEGFLNTIEVNQNDIWSHHEALMASDDNTSENNGTSIELRQYLSQKVCDRKNNPIQVWLSMKAVYPNLYKVAVQYMCIVASSVPSECLFSKAGAIARERRNRLTGKNLNTLLFLNSLSDEK